MPFRVRLMPAAAGIVASWIVSWMRGEVPNESVANPNPVPEDESLIRLQASSSPLIFSSFPDVLSLPTNSSVYESVDAFREAVSMLIAMEAIDALQYMITINAQLQPASPYDHYPSSYLVSKQDIMNFLYAMPYVNIRQFTEIVRHMIKADAAEVLIEMMVDRPDDEKPFYRIPVFVNRKNYRPQLHPDEPIFKPLTLLLESVRTGGPRVVKALFNIILQSQPEEHVAKQGDMLRSVDPQNQGVLFQAAFRGSVAEFEMMLSLLMNLTHDRASLYGKIAFLKGKAHIKTDGNRELAAEERLRKKYHTTKNSKYLAQLEAVITAQHLVYGIDNDPFRQMKLNAVIRSLRMLSRWYFTQTNTYGLTVRDYLVATYGETDPRVKLLDRYARDLGLTVEECQGKSVVAHVISTYARASRISVTAIGYVTGWYEAGYKWAVAQGIVSVVEGTPEWFRQQGFDITTSVVAAVLAVGADNYYDMQVATIKKALGVLHHIFGQHNEADLTLELVLPRFIDVVPNIKWSTIVFKWFPDVADRAAQKVEIERFKAKWEAWFPGELEVVEEERGYCLVLKPTKQPQLKKVGTDGIERTPALAVVHSCQEVGRFASALNKQARVNLTGVSWTPHLDEAHAVDYSARCLVTTRAMTEAEADTYLARIKPEYKEWFYKEDTGDSSTSRRWKIYCNVPEGVTVAEIKRSTLLTARSTSNTGDAAARFFTTTSIHTTTTSPAKQIALQEAREIRQLKIAIREIVGALGQEAVEDVLSKYGVVFSDGEVKFPTRLKDQQNHGRKQAKYLTTKTQQIAGLVALQNELQEQVAAVAAPVVAGGYG